MTASPLNVLVVGGGVAGLEALLALSDLAGDRVALTLLSPTREYVHRAMAVAETFSLGRAPRVPLARVASDTGAELVEGKLAEVRPDERRVALVDGRELGYDALLLAVGGPSVPAVPHAMTWTPEAAPELLGGLLRDLEEGYGTRGVAFIVPSGVAWALPAYELALMTARQVQGMGQHPPLFLLTPEPAPLAVFGTAASEAVAEELDAVGIAVRTHAADVELEHSDPLTAIIEPAHERLSLSRAVALPRQLGPGLAGLPADTRGFLRTDRLMRVEERRPRLGGGRRGGLPRQAGRPRSAAGRRRRAGHRRAGRNRPRPPALPPAAARQAHDGPSRPLDPHRRARRREPRRRGGAGALVATGKGRRPLSRALPGQPRGPGRARPRARGWNRRRGHALGRGNAGVELTGLAALVITRFP